MEQLNQESETITMELVQTGQSTALEQMERAQIDVQISTAHRYPRSMELFHKKAMSMVTLDEETAAKCIYRRPVGKKKNEKGEWVEEFAEGESVRMAEIVAASYGNFRCASKIVEQTERLVRCVGMAHDLESNYASQSECVEATVKKDGTPYSEAMRVVIAKSCLAKARRDATFQVIPKALCKKLSEAARKTAIGDSATLETRRTKLNDWITKSGVDHKRVWASLGINGMSDVTLEHLETLIGIITAIKEGDTTLDEAFPPIKSEVKGPSFVLPTTVTKTEPAVVESKREVKSPTAESVTTTESIQQTPPTATENPLETLHKLMAGSNPPLEEAQVIAFCQANKYCKSNQSSLSSLSESKLTTLCANFSQVVAWQ